MRYVLDANVALRWVLVEQDSDKAKRLRDDHHNAVHELIAPDSFTIECANSQTEKNRLGRNAMATIDRPTADKPPAIPAEDLAELERTIQNLMKGVRDPAAMDRAAKEMDEAREEIRQRLGEVNLAAELTERDE